MGRWFYAYTCNQTGERYFRWNGRGLAKSESEIFEKYHYKI